MRNISNKIRFVAFVVILLSGTINVWAAAVDFTKSHFNNPNAVEMNLNRSLNAYGIVIGDGNVSAQVYADLTNYNGIRVKGTKNKSVRFLFNSNGNSNYIEVTKTINSHGVLELDFKDEAKLKDLSFCHLNCIKIPNGESGVTITEVKVFDRNYYFEGKEVQARQVYSMSYRVPINSQREFTFKQSRKYSEGAIRKYNWAMSVFDNILEGGGCRELLYMDCSPTAYGRENHNEQSISDHVDVTEIYKVGAVGSNGINIMNHLTEDMWNEFLVDMFNDADVSVKVSNYDGYVRVYAVMKSTSNGQTRTYVYPYQYTKYEGAADDVYVCLTEDHTNIWDLQAHSPVGLTKLDYSNPKYTGTGTSTRNCYVTIYTEEGYAIPRGTKTGLNDKVKYLAVPTWGWKFSKWSSGTTDNPHPITIGASHISAGICNPEPTFAADATHDIAKNRIFHLDFESVTNEMLLSGDGAPINEPAKDDQGKFYNYGGKGRILKDDIFGNYYQNLADNPNEYTASKAENFLRYILTDEQQAEFGKINEAHGPKAATIGFWVNGSVAVDYELPLERGSMFCIFSNERFRKANDGQVNPGQEPRFMFDISCNGWVYSYMPNSYFLTDDEGNYILDDNSNRIKVDYVNKFFYGETSPVAAENYTPKVSLFGVNNYAHTQDQRKHKFYDDKRWHYVTYVATEDLKKITMYLDGEEVGVLDTRILEDMQFFDENGDYPGRARYLRNIVLGGFTPHGLFFEKQYYSDAALAYDDISIYSVALTQNQIKDIIEAKGYSTTPKEWHFASALKSEGEAKKVELTSDIWKHNGNGIYETKGVVGKANNQMKNCVPLTSGGKTLYSTEGLTFSGDAGKILIDQKNGLIGLKQGSMITVPDIPRGAFLYFVVKSEDRERYSLDHYDIYSNPVASFYTRGVSRYGGEGKEDFYLLCALRENSTGANGFDIYSHKPNNRTKHHHADKHDNILWFSDIVISPYCLLFAKENTNMNHRTDVETVDDIDVVYDDNGNATATDEYGNVISGYMNANGTTNFPKLIIQKIDINNSINFHNHNDTELLANYAKGNAAGNPYVRFSSSAPHVATVDQNGKVTVKGVAGYAIIKAELIFGNLHDGCISTAYQIRVTKPKTKHVEDNTNYEVAENQTIKANDGSDAITMSLGGWAYTDNAYAGTEDDELDNDDLATDSWAKGEVFAEINDQNPVDGFNTYSQGKQNAKSENYGAGDGRFVPRSGSLRNVTPWQLPCRGSYLKFDVEKPGVLTVYVLQNGNLHKTDINSEHSDKVYWRPVYITDERGVCVSNVQYSTNSKIAENDNFFFEGRRRAQFIENVQDTYNQRLVESLLAMKTENYNHFKTLIDNWENQGWKQKVIKTGDGGYMVMSKGIVRYSFNVLPGQTYYVFSNDTKLGYAGYNFEEGKRLKAETNETYETAPLWNASVVVNPIIYKDVLQSEYTPTLPEDLTSKHCVPIEYERSFTANTWSSICLPFSMNRKQMEENFGEGTAVVLLKQVFNSGKDRGKMELVWHVNQDIIAGYPYFILPTKNVSKITANVHFTKKLTAPSLAVSSNGKSYAHNGSYTYYSDYPYIFEGNFNDVEIPAGSYVMSNTGTLTRLKNNVTAKPFRAYVRCIDAANAKPLTAMEVDDSESETTSIDELLQDNGIILEGSDVYGVNGLKVRSNTHSLEGLSKGVYVVNGKKYVVK